MKIEILQRKPGIRTLVCPLNEKSKPGPITKHGLYPDYILTDEDIRLFEKLAPLPKPTRQHLGTKSHRNG